MIKALEQAVEKVKKLSSERQEYAAAMLEQIAESGDGIYTLTDEERRNVDQITSRLAARVSTTPVPQQVRGKRTILRDRHSSAKADTR